MKVYHRVWLFNNLPSFEDLTRTKSNKVHLKTEEKKFFPGDCLIDIDKVFKKIIKKEHKFEKCLFFKISRPGTTNSDRQQLFTCTTCKLYKCDLPPAITENFKFHLKLF